MTAEFTFRKSGKYTAFPVDFCIVNNKRYKVVSPITVNLPTIIGSSKRIRNFRNENFEFRGCLIEDAEFSRVAFIIDCEFEIPVDWELVGIIRKTKSEELLDKAIRFLKEQGIEVISKKFEPPVRVNGNLEYLNSLNREELSIWEYQYKEGFGYNLHYKNFNQKIRVRFNVDWDKY